MTARHGLVFYSCGHQDPIPTGPDRQVARACQGCIKLEQARRQACVKPAGDAHQACIKTLESRDLWKGALWTCACGGVKSAWRELCFECEAAA